MTSAPESLGQAGPHQSPYHDTMVDHDKNGGQVLDYLDELGIAEDTFVMYSTDNGPHMNSWPDGAMTPFRSEKDTNWEGAFRVPLLVRWPGKIPAGVISNEIVQHHDWLPTFCAIAGDADIPKKLLKGHKASDKTFKVHIDGYNLLPYLTVKGEKCPRQAFLIRPWKKCRVASPDLPRPELRLPDFSIDSSAVRKTHLRIAENTFEKEGVLAPQQ